MTKKEVTLVSKNTQPSGLLCLWQCFFFYRKSQIYNLLINDHRVCEGLKELTKGIWMIFSEAIILVKNQSGNSDLYSVCRD